MNIARILYPVKVLGPGRRIGIWVCGCKRACPGCSNPELWERQSRYEITPENAAVLIRKISAQHPVDGFTISGGEPFDQAEELSVLLSLLQEISKDVLIYTGYTLDELRAHKTPGTNALLQAAAVLIDGPYLEEQNLSQPMKGSANQRIHLLRQELAPRYTDYLTQVENRIQNFSTLDGIVSVGIHNKGFTPPTSSRREG